MKNNIVKGVYHEYEEKTMSIQFIVDEKGNKTGVLLDINEYEELLERVEDAEAVKMLNKMREKPLEYMKFEDFLKENA